MGLPSFPLMRGSRSRLLRVLCLAFFSASLLHKGGAAGGAMAEYAITSTEAIPHKAQAMLQRQKKAIRVNNEHYFRRCSMACAL